MKRLILLLLIACLALPASPSVAEGNGRCLSPREQRELIRSGEVVRPGRIARQLDGEVLRVRLCQAGRSLVWQLTVLGSNGRVVGHVMDARSGRRVR